MVCAQCKLRWQIFSQEMHQMLAKGSFPVHHPTIGSKPVLGRRRLGVQLGNLLLRDGQKLMWMDLLFLNLVRQVLASSRGTANVK
jgi:hypothetical protein